MCDLKKLRKRFEHSKDMIKKIDDISNLWKNRAEKYKLKIDIVNECIKDTL